MGKIALPHSLDFGQGRLRRLLRFAGKKSCPNPLKLRHHYHEFFEYKRTSHEPILQDAARKNNKNFSLSSGIFGDFGRLFSAFRQGNSAILRISEEIGSSVAKFGKSAGWPMSENKAGNDKKREAV